VLARVRRSENSKENNSPAHATKQRVTQLGTPFPPEPTTIYNKTGYYYCRSWPVRLALGKPAT